MGRSKIIIIFLIALCGCSSAPESTVDKSPPVEFEDNDPLYCNPIRNWTVVNPHKLASVENAIGMWSEYVTFDNHGTQIFIDVADTLQEPQWVGSAAMMRDVCVIYIRSDYMDDIGVALHEIGHCIGLWGHSEDPTSTMFHRYNSITTITPDIPQMLEEYNVDRGCDYDE